jgi:hypothetical protein
LPAPGGLAELDTIALAMVVLAAASSSSISRYLAVESWAALVVRRVGWLAGYLVLMLAALPPTGGDHRAGSQGATTALSRPSRPLP